MMMGYIVIGVFVVMISVVLVGVYNWGYSDGLDERSRK